MTFEIATHLKNQGKNIIPGWQLCHSCYETAKQTQDYTSTDESNNTSDDKILGLQGELIKKVEKEQLDQSLSSLGISPMKAHGLPKSTKTNIAQRKLEQIFEKQKDYLASLCDVSKTDLTFDNVSPQTENSVLQKARDLDRLLDLMKEKLNDKSLKTSQKTEIMTFAPESWSRTKVASFFNVSEYVAREALKVKSSKGVLELLDKKRRRKLNEEVTQDVYLFYEDDEYSRMMPCTKNYVSLGKKFHN